MLVTTQTGKLYVTGLEMKQGTDVISWDKAISVSAREKI